MSEGLTWHLPPASPRLDPPAGLVQQPHGQHEQSGHKHQHQGGDGQVLKILVEDFCGAETHKPDQNQPSVQDGDPERNITEQRSSFIVANVKVCLFDILPKRTTGSLELTEETSVCSKY